MAPKPDPHSSVTTPGTRDGTPVAGECPSCHRSELVSITAPPRDEETSATYPDGTAVAAGTKVVLCPLCGYVLDKHDEKDAGVKRTAAKRSPAKAKRTATKRAPAKRAKAKRTAAKRAPAKAKRTATKRAPAKRATARGR